MEKETREKRKAKREVRERKHERGVRKKETRERKEKNEGREGKEEGRGGKQKRGEYRVWLLIVAQNADCNIAFRAQTSLLWGSVGEAVYL